MSEKNPAMPPKKGMDLVVSRVLEELARDRARAQAAVQAWPRVMEEQRAAAVERLRRLREAT